MLKVPITKKEWKIICNSPNNEFPLHIIHNLKKKLIAKKQNKNPQPQQHNKPKNG